MSKLGCICGHTIVDQTDNIPYKAKFIRDQDQETFWKYADDIASFIDAIQSNRRDAWIKSYFSENYPPAIDNASIIFDIVSYHERGLAGELYQCENCGRVKIEVEDTNQFASFRPEDDRFQYIFQGIHKEQDGG